MRRAFAQSEGVTAIPGLQEQEEYPPLLASVGNASPEIIYCGILGKWCST
jgi:hypothetical protein